MIGGLRQAVAAWGGRGLLATALVLLLYRRLGEISRRFGRLAERFRAGRVFQRGPRPVDAARVTVERAPVERVWPLAFGWLVRMAAYEAAGFGSQLRAILVEPEMVALLEAVPQAGRLLRPLCRMLAIEAQVVRPGIAAEVPEDAPAVRVRVRKPRAKVDWGRIPLPRGVLSAARRQGFAKR